MNIGTKCRPKLCPDPGITKFGNEFIVTIIHINYDFVFTIGWKSLFLLYLNDIIYLLLEREEEKKKNFVVREKHGLDASCTPPAQGPGLQLRHVPCLGAEPVVFHIAGQQPASSCSSQGWISPFHLFHYLLSTI